LFGFGRENVDIDGLEETADVSETLSFTNNNGWHLLGNPYNVSIDWNTDITTNANIDNVYNRWTGTEYEFFPGGGLTSTIEKWSGFLVHANNTGGQIDVSFPGPAKRSVQVMPNIDWRIQIIAESGENRDTHNYLGVSQKASRSFDPFDKYELTPLDEEFISVYFPHDSWEDRQGNYTQDIRRSEDDEITWDIEVASLSANEEISLTWTILDELGDEYEVTLTDNETGKTVDMRSQNGYSYHAPVAVNKTSSIPKMNYNPSNLAYKLGQDGVNLKQITVTIRKSVTEDRGIIPDVYYLEQNYPNPFNPTTTIRYGLPEDGHVTLKIFNTLGQEVATLVNSDQIAGIRSVVWNSTNSSGNLVSSGVYFYQIRAGSFTQIKRLLLIR